MKRIFVAGDVMLGRLVDQIFPTHVTETLDGKHAKTLLRSYKMEEKVQELGHKYVWGDVLPFIMNSDLKIINLETSVTTWNEKWPNKEFNYRMHPDNLQCLKEVGIDYCALANNHTLDFGVQGMIDTMKSLTASGIKWAGVGMNKKESMEPVTVETKNLKLLCYSFADHPRAWAASETKPGINFLDVENCSDQELKMITSKLESDRREQSPSLVSVSIHWGSNYCWKPSRNFQNFARHLIDHGVDMIHGHSSHHVQGIEIYKGKPILYGCGDFIDDYAVDPDFRNDLGFAYFLNFEGSKFSSIELLPTRVKCFQTNILGAGTEDYEWLVDKMAELSADFGTVIKKEPTGFLKAEV